MRGQGDEGEGKEKGEKKEGGGAGGIRLRRCNLCP